MTKTIQFRNTVFKYQCSCGVSDFLKFHKNIASCTHCAAEFPLLDDNIIMFYSGSNEQTEYFDDIYSAGEHTHSSQQIPAEKMETYQWHQQWVPQFASLSGISNFSNLDILEVACGTGGITAGLMQTETVRNCRFHAFDISSFGLKVLVDFIKDKTENNKIELSVQNANKMMFADSSFDLILGNSIVHHFDEYENFFEKCYKLLKPQGCAIFGEPFALGHIFAVISMRIANEILDKKTKGIEEYYNSIAFRLENAKSKDALAHMVDKHLFFQSELTELAHNVGFSVVEFSPRGSFESYAEGIWLEKRMNVRGVDDPEVRNESRRIYRMIADLFGESAYVNGLAGYIDIILKK